MQSTRVRRRVGRRGTHLQELRIGQFGGSYAHEYLQALLLDCGADDYLTKPFHAQELVARLNALIRRSAGKASSLIENGPFSINTSSLEVKKDQQLIALSSSEYKLFEYLMLHVGEVKSKTVLTEHIYDQDFDLDSNVIEVFIRRLRLKLDAENHYGIIETLRGQGYRMKPLHANKENYEK